MNLPTKFKEYIWLVNTIRNARKITLSEINRKWLLTDMSEGVELARSTFNRHKNAIETMFGIYIECDLKNGYKYYIGNENVFHEDSVQNWMLSTLSVSNVISDSLALQKRIVLQPVPSEGENLSKIIEAMKKNVKLKVVYRKYGTDTPRVFDLEPYCIKLFKQRWYVLAHFHRKATEEKPESDYMGIFSLDRIQNIELTDTKFHIDPDFDAQEYFDESYGVMVDERKKTERIVIRAYDTQRFYLRDLPLHRSQKEIGQGENYADFELFMKPTNDFCGDLISRFNQVKVLSPQWLADDIRKKLADTIALYDHNGKGE